MPARPPPMAPRSGDRRSRRARSHRVTLRLPSRCQPVHPRWAPRSGDGDREGRGSHRVTLRLRRSASSVHPRLGAAERQRRSRRARSHRVRKRASPIASVAAARQDRCRPRPTSAPRPSATCGPWSAATTRRLHDDQWAAIEALVVDRRRALVVQRTGWGKSAVYFVATLLLRAEGAGPTVIVSPLLALMRNQIAAAERAGIRAVTINSTNIEQWQEIQTAVDAGEVDVLLVSPERLNNPGFRDEVLPRLAATCGLLVVDEAHCISDWGHDFRPDYRRIRTLLADLPAGIPVLATTATANARVSADVAEQLGTATVEDALVLRGSLDRESLRLGVRPAAHPRAAAGLARRPPRRAARLRHRLLPDGRRHAAGRRLPARPRPRRRGVLRPDRADRAAGARGARSPPAGSRRWWPPARSAWASTPPSASWSTSARRSRRSPTTSRSAAPAAAPTSASVVLLPAAGGPGHLGLLRLARRSRARTRCATRCACWPRRAAAQHRRARDLRRPRPHPAGADAQGARRRRRRTPGPRRLGGDRRRTGATTPSATSGCSRGAQARAAGDARLPRHRPVPDVVPARPARRPGRRRRRPRCGRCDTLRRPRALDRGLRRRRRRGAHPAGASRRRRRAAERCGRRRWPTSGSTSAAASAKAPSPGGPWPG